VIYLRIDGLDNKGLNCLGKVAVLDIVLSSKAKTKSFLAAIIISDIQRPSKGGNIFLIMKEKYIGHFYRRATLIVYRR
jgi:hypothetical protein